MRWPYFVEDKLGIDMSYYYARNVPANVLVYEERRLVKEDDLDELKKMVFKD